jgi:hypothetical protein
MQCWICNDKLKKYEYILLPEKNDYYEIPLQKNTYEIILIYDLAFLYYILCCPCMSMYLDNYPFNFKRILKREIIGIMK